MNSLGIMQGRLTPSRGRGIQFFPFENWQNEFYLAREIGLDEIEFIFDYDNFYNNPLWSYEGIKTIKQLIGITGIKVNTICLDYFMERAFYKNPILKQENEYVIGRLIRAADYIGCSTIEIPLIDKSSLLHPQEAIDFKNFLLSIVDTNNSNIKINLETDLNPELLKTYISSFDLQNLAVTFDTGNSAGLKYSPSIEIPLLSHLIQNVHIKDKDNYSSIELGTGNVEFEKVFLLLKKIKYKNSFILQTARSPDGQEVFNIKKQLEFIRRYL